MAKAEKQPYQPTEAEQRSLCAQAKRKAERRAAPGMKVVTVADGKADIRVDANPAVAEAVFCESLGTTSSTFASLIAQQVGFLSTAGVELNANVLNAHLSLVQGVRPRDEVETMLATQMAAIHILTMNAASTAYRAKSNAAMDAQLNQLNKLARTFAAQVEALKRHRSKGDQKVVVEHVHVHEGGQAVVGNVYPGGGGSQKNGGQPHAQRIADARQPALPCDLEALGVPVQGAGR